MDRKSQGKRLDDAIERDGGETSCDSLPSDFIVLMDDFLLGLQAARAQAF